MPDERLRAAAAFVRQGAVFADIGTDHAYLPVFLCENNAITRAFACDVVEGPLSVAVAHIAQSGLSNRITPILTDGLTGLEGYGITDIAICGMGGELIVSILSRAPFIKDARIRLILQPMTHARDVREYLAKEGFAIVGECVREAAGKLYFCFAAEYMGKPYAISRMEAELGARNIERCPPEKEFCKLLAQKIHSAERRVRGLAAGGLSVQKEQEYLNELYRLRDALVSEGAFRNDKK